MQDLFRKYLDNKCSPAEIKELLGYFNVRENELLLRRFITESLDNDADEGEWNNLTEKTFTLIRQQLDTEKVKVIPVFKKTWFRVAAAAIVLMGAFAIYNLINNADKHEPGIVSNDKGTTAPGSNKAILTLADGSTIILQRAANGTLSMQGDTKIVKLQNGQLVYNSLNEKPAGGLFNSITTPRGGQYQLTLSDGSKVWLNAASSLRFPVAFSGSERRVEITGEAYFEVAKNASMPFKVNIAGKAEVAVLGTHFNISSYPDETTINTTLLEGSVKVTGLTNGNIYVISPGEQAALHTSGQISLNKKVDIEQVIAWHKGMFNFTSASLETVLRQLSRWYDVDVSFEGPIPEIQFGGEMQRDLNLSQVLRILEKSNVHFRLEGKKLIVLK